MKHYVRHKSMQGNKLSNAGSWLTGAVLVAPPITSLMKIKQRLLKEGKK